MKAEEREADTWSDYPSLHWVEHVKLQFNVDRAEDSSATYACFHTPIQPLPSFHEKIVLEID